MKPKVLWIKDQWLLLLAIGILPLMLGCMTMGGVAHSTEWKDPPPIEMQDCIQVDRAIGPNPFSDDPNDLALVTAYEEKESQDTDKKAFLLVNGIFLDQVRRLQVVYFSAVVVNISHRENDIGKVSYWILADTKSKGRIDKALYREKVVTNSGAESTVSEVEGTKEQIARLQAYYERAVRMMSAKAESEQAENCPTGNEGESI